MKTANTPSNTKSFRLIARGIVTKGRKEVRVRRVKHVRAASFEQAAEAMAKQGPAMIKGMKPSSVYLNVFAPVQ